MTLPLPRDDGTPPRAHSREVREGKRSVRKAVARAEVEMGLRQPRVCHKQAKRCPQKARYPTALIAFRAVQALVGKPGRDECRAYECPYCDGWHVTSRSSRAWMDGLA